MDETIVGVVGPWADHTALIEALLQQDPPRYLFAGAVLLELSTKQALVLELQARGDEDGSIAWLIDNTRSIDGAKLLLRAASALVDAGGEAVIVETAGHTVEPERWQTLAARGGSLAAYQALVVLVGGEDKAYSCGMHNFGLPDVSISTEVPPEAMPSLLTAFNHWQLLARPTLTNGDLFADELDSIVLAMKLLPYGYDEDSPLNNPHGRWHLEPTDQPLELVPAFTGDGPLFMALDDDDPEVIASIAAARRTVGRLVRMVNSDEYGLPLMKIRLTSGDESAFIWLAVDEASDASLTGTLFEVPPELAPYEEGQQITVPIDELQDWCIRKSGAVIGGFSMRIQRANIAEESRRHFDLYTGNLCYAPVDELE